MPNKQELKALKDAISHWEKNVRREARGKELMLGAKECPCCQLQMQRQSTDLSFECFHPTGDCAIAAYTERDSCQGTPYEALFEEHYEKNDSVLQMYNWLKSLYLHLTDPENHDRPKNE